MFAEGSSPSISEFSLDSVEIYMPTIFPSFDLPTRMCCFVLLTNISSFIKRTTTISDGMSNIWKGLEYFQSRFQENNNKLVVISFQVKYQKEIWQLQLKWKALNGICDKTILMTLTKW